MKKKIISFLIAVSALLGLALLNGQTSEAATTENNNDPVIFVPGAFDNETSWKEMIAQLDPNNEHPVTKFSADIDGQILRQDVRSGNSNERPFVVVLFPQNSYTEKVISKDADALRDALLTYNQKNPFKQADIVGHSNGGTITTTYLEKNASKSGFSFHFNHFISIGTPYNFQAVNGADNTAFLNRLIRASGSLPSDLNVTNVIGSMPNDSSTDGVVSRDSALSGKKIFPGNVASFQQLFITGEDAEHGNQESSPQVAKIIQDIFNI